MRVLMAEGPTSAKACRWEKVRRVLGRVELGQRGYGSVSLGDCWLIGNGTCLCQIMPSRCPRTRRHRAVWEPGRGKHLCASSTGLDSYPSLPRRFCYSSSFCSLSPNSTGLSSVLPDCLNSATSSSNYFDFGKLLNWL